MIKAHFGEQLPEILTEEIIEILGNNISLEMVAIPGGTFLMGSPTTEAERYISEEPHWVTVAPFFIGKYQITQAQWQAVAALPKINRDLKPNPYSFKGENRPVENVSWLEAVEFCARVSQKTQREYRLPSEAEWEYACRAGTTNVLNMPCEKFLNIGSSIRLGLKFLSCYWLKAFMK